LKIVQVTTELRPAGAEKIVATLSKALANSGHEVTVISLCPLPSESVIIEELEEAKVKILSLGLTKKTVWRIFKLRKILNSLSPDIVHSHLIHANICTRLNWNRSKTPLVNTVHIAERRQGKNWHFTLDKLTLSRCSCQTAVSKAVRDFHCAKLNVSPDSMPVIYNGIIPPAVTSPSDISALRKEWQVEECDKLIGSVGRLDWQKGYDIFLQQLTELGKLIPENQNWGVVLLGEGPERSNLEKIAANAPANISVKLPGFRADAPDCIGAFDLFVMPSRYEGFGLTLAEAMAQGVTILCSNMDSLPELIADYPAGKDIDFENAPAREIIDFINKAKIAPDLRFSDQEMVANYLDLYHKLKG
jgi:glycosyltransferase involved in cell wall biosynthesis